MSSNDAKNILCLVTGALALILAALHFARYKKGPKQLLRKIEWLRTFYVWLGALAILGGTWAFFLPIAINSGFNKNDDGPVLRQLLIYTTGGLLGAITLGETRRKNDQDHTRQVHAERRSRYTTAIEQLSNDKASIRLGGVYTLVGLVDEWLADEKTTPSLEERRKEGQVIINNLCAYIRSPFLLAERAGQLDKPYTKDLQKDFGGDKEKFDADKQTFKQHKATLEEERQVRLSIIKEMHEHLHDAEKPGPWSAFNYDFSNTHFFYVVSFNHSYLSALLNFSGAKFTGYANFSLAEFTGYANFSWAEFTGNANFSWAEFTGNANFSMAKFTGNANFSMAKFTKRADFCKASFGGEANFFDGAFLQGADFSEVKFTGDATFSDAHFAESTNFFKATFTGDGTFYKAKFIGPLLFSRALFMRNATFSKAKFAQEANFFMTVFTKEADFSSSKFSGHASFFEVKFSSSANFFKTKFAENTRFSGAQFNGPTNFSITIFHSKPEFANTPNKNYKAKFSHKAAPADYSFKTAAKSPYKIETREQEHNGVKFIIPEDAMLFDPDNPVAWAEPAGG